MFSQKKNSFLALGLYDPDSPIRIKVLSLKNGTQINEEWFTEKISAAQALRQPLLQTDTNAYRLLFGENDGLPSIICDIYDKVAVLKIYSRSWWPYLTQIKEALLQVVPLEAIVYREARILHSHSGPYSEGEVIFGALANPEILFREHGVRFASHVVKGHKTGFFLDHRHNRLEVQKRSKNKTVLDVFSYAGGFSVHALCGGAREVTSVDISGQALKLAQKNALLNNVTGRHLVLKGDAFVLLETKRKEGKRYDIVIIDPPAMAKANKEVATAMRQYERLTKLGADLVNPGGQLMLASCSSRVKTDDFIEMTRRILKPKGWKEEQITRHDIDHPVTLEEGWYLKTIWWTGPKT